MLLLRLMPAAAASRLDRLNKVDNTKAKERIEATATLGGKSSAHNKLVNDAIMDKCAVQVSSLVAEAVSG